MFIRKCSQSLQDMAVYVDYTKVSIYSEKRFLRGEGNDTKRCVALKEKKQKRQQQDFTAL